MKPVGLASTTWRLALVLPLLTIGFITSSPAKPAARAAVDFNALETVLPAGSETLRTKNSSPASQRLAAHRLGKAIRGDVDKLQ